MLPGFGTKPEMKNEHVFVFSVHSNHIINVFLNPFHPHAQKYANLYPKNFSDILLYNLDINPRNTMRRGDGGWYQSNLTGPCKHNSRFNTKPLRGGECDFPDIWSR